MCYHVYMRQESWLCEICEWIYTEYDVSIIMCRYCRDAYNQYDNAVEMANISKIIYESGYTMFLR